MYAVVIQKIIVIKNVALLYVPIDFKIIKKRILQNLSHWMLIHIVLNKFGTLNYSKYAYFNTYMEDYVNIPDNTFIIYKIFNNPIIVYQSQLL